MVGRYSHFGLWTRADNRPTYLTPNLSDLRALRGGPLPSAPFHAHRKAFYLMRISGTVKFFNSAKGFGFITPDEGGKDVFVHATAVEAAGMRALNEGDRVSFELEDDRKGRGKQAGQLKPA
jgi:cold shock protein